MKRFVLFVCIVCLWLTGCALPSESDTAGGVTDTTQAETVPPSSAQPTHTGCRYCGELEGDSRWFIARVMENGMVMPLGTDCFEATSAMDAGISLHYSAVDGEAGRRLAAGEIVRITYNGCIMETYPVQIRADSVTVEDAEEEVEVETETDAEAEDTDQAKVEIEVETAVEDDRFTDESFELPSDWGNKYYLVLPISRKRVEIRDGGISYMKDIDADLLKTAEEKIAGQISQYELIDDPYYHIYVKDGALWLGAEVIVKIEPEWPSSEPGASDEHEIGGCGIDHDHKFFSEQITK